METELDLLTIGDCSIDMFMELDKDFVSTEYEGQKLEICFFHGSKVPVESFGTSIAGNACNVAVAATKLGLKTGIYTELGEDAYGDRIINEMAEQGIDTSSCIKNPGTPTNVHAIVVHAGDRTIFSYHEPRDYKIHYWPKPKWIFYSSLAKGFDEFQAQLVIYLKEHPDVAVAFNPGTQQLREGLPALKNILEMVSVLFVNTQEAQMILSTEETDLLTLHKKLQELGPKLTVITLADKGSTAFDGKKLMEEGIYDDAAPIVDKTGAGDSYAAGFIAALFYGKPLKEAMRWGSINSSGVIRKIGAIQGLRTKKEIEAVL